ncbi:MAG: hypothetical protein EA425_03045 [Puniceicoccaceae bacterium]|nr:MAG: hypothetical protein EA425_03045 [Puniceicoccaceae bacterium]
MQQLKCADLRPGDLLLKVTDSSWFNKVIQLGQTLARQRNTSITHAGILFDNTVVIEAQRVGLNANDLRVQTRHLGYYVFRPHNRPLADGAATCAKLFFDIHGRTNTMPYSKPGAAGSLIGGPGRPASRERMETVLDRILEGRNHPFFCSQFVVYVYQFAAEQAGLGAGSLFNLSDAKVSPSVLASLLATHPSFAEIGYLMPGER